MSATTAPIKKRPARLHWWYEAAVDWIIANPDKRLGDGAKFFDVTQAWFSTVIHSDLFQERLAERRRDVSQAIKEEVLDRAGRVAAKSLKQIEQRLDNQETSKIPLKSLSEVTETALKALGYGVGGATSIVVNNQNNVAVVETAASPETIREVRQQMREGQTSVVDSPRLVERPTLDLTAAPPRAVSDQLDLPIDEAPTPKQAPVMSEDLLELAEALDAA